MSAPAPRVARAAQIARVIATWRVEHGLTANQADALLQVFDAGALSAADLSRRVGITTASMSRLLAGLERDAWIERMPDPYDARRSFVQAGKRLAVAMEQLATMLARAERPAAVDGIDERMSTA